MITREQYLADSSVLHHDYYMQFVTPQTLRTVETYVSLARIQTSSDPHLNDIPLGTWDELPMAYNREAMERAGDYLTAAGHVCIMKAAAKHLLTENKIT